MSSMRNEKLKRKHKKQSERKIREIEIICKRGTFASSLRRLIFKVRRFLRENK